jgi:predicted DsbA family dithiol-disulfide isomerase
VQIDIYSDVVCPWCYIGKRRLDQALESHPGEATVRYLPFQLDPKPVASPRPLLDSLAAKFGGPERTRQITERTRAVAEAEGLKLDFDRAVTANTFDAHRLVWFARTDGAVDRHADVVEALHRAHFTDGVDVGSRSALGSLAAEVGLDESGVREFLESNAGVDEVTGLLRQPHERGVTSVPTFVLAGKYAVTGAQESGALRAAFDEVTRRSRSSERSEPATPRQSQPQARYQ